MSRQARIEEASDTDSDPMEMDPSDFEPPQYPALAPSASARGGGNSNASEALQSLLSPSLIPSQHQTSYASAQDLTKFKAYQCLYPVYFDAKRSRAQGRRVCKTLAVKNPLAHDIVDAVQGLGLSALFEPGKQHPKDWANPGRVKVLVKKDGVAVLPKKVKNKHHLYKLILDYLRRHPTTEESARRLRIPHMPSPGPNEPYPKPAIPRGWKMGSILPPHSPALGGGGFTEDTLKEMMAGMQGQTQGADRASEQLTGGDNRKKEKKKKGKA